MFSFELEEGDKTTALVNPNSIILSRSASQLLFQDESPIGKIIDFSDRQLPFPLNADGVGAPPVSWGNFTVTGVIDDSKYLSHLKFDALVSYSSRATLYADKKIGNDENNWEWYWRAYTYVLLRKGVSKQALDNSLVDLVKRKYASLKSEQVKGFKLEAQPLSGIQLGLSGNDTDNRMPSIGYYFLAILATVVMLTACLNYTNLSVARALTRAKEIGVRKVTGATQRSLVAQFLSESVITSLLALVMAIALLALIRPAFKSLWVNQFLEFELTASPWVFIVFFAFAVFIGLFAGLYPAFQLSKYQPIKALKNLSNVQGGKMRIRKVLSASQLAISLMFITSSLLVYNQFKHFLEFDYGFSSKNIINIELQGIDYAKLSHEITTIKEVSTISASDIIPSTGRSNGIQIRKPNTSEEALDLGILNIDENFIANLDIKILAGRNIPPPGVGNDKYIIINEQASKLLGFTHPSEAVGQLIETRWDQPIFLQIVGVVQDFRYHLLINRHEIEPLILRNVANDFQYLEVKVDSKDLMNTVTEIEKKWKKLDAIHPMKYEFYDQQLAATHRGILDLVSILGTIAFLAVVIACLGMLGMAIYTAERKTKEVGIRKVLGAGDWNIALLLSNEFMKVLGWSIIIGAPLSYFLNNMWLELLPNRVAFGLGTVLAGASILLTLGLLTIGSQTLKAAKSNPIDALRVD